MAHCRSLSLEYGYLQEQSQSLLNIHGLVYLLQSLLVDVMADESNGAAKYKQPVQYANVNILACLLPGVIIGCHIDHSSVKAYLPLV